MLAIIYLMKQQKPGQGACRGYHLLAVCMIIRKAVTFVGENNEIHDIMCIERAKLFMMLISTLLLPSLLCHSSPALQLLIIGTQVQRYPMDEVDRYQARFMIIQRGDPQTPNWLIQSLCTQGWISTTPQQLCHESQSSPCLNSAVLAFMSIEASVDVVPMNVNMV